MTYEDFKIATLEAGRTIDNAYAMTAVTEEFTDGFHCAMREAREIFMRLEDADEKEAVRT